MEETIKKTEYNAILVGLDLGEGKYRYAKFEDVMTELEELAQAAEVNTVAVMIQSRPSVDVRYYIGKGKVEELCEMVQNMGANLVIFNNELSGSQIRNLEDELCVDVIDRTTLILDIFAKRAVTGEGKLQVELAQLKYKLPRLSNTGEGLSGTGAGIGARGPGEKKLETDKRRIRRKIFEIERELKEVQKNREVQRKSRKKSAIPIVALAGYTNAGKSTLFNRLIQSHRDYAESKKVFVKDMLFATLDTSLRKAELPNGNEYLLTDTVGFVSDLPHDLVNAFHSTLEELTYADLILHVVDVSNEKYDLQMNTTETVFEEIGVDGIPILTVFNKADLAEDDVLMGRGSDKILISAKSGYHLEELLQKVQSIISSNKPVTMKISYEKGNLLNYFHSKYRIEDERYEEDGTYITFSIDEADYNKYREFMAEQ